jgi:hypothetical protein
MRNNGDLEKAILFFSKAIKLQPEFDQAYVQRSRLECNNIQLDETNLRILIKPCFLSPINSIII